MNALLLALLLAAPSSSDGGDAVDRAIARAVGRTQSKLEREVVLFVDHTTWENAWQIETENFRVTTPMNWYIGAGIARDLETILPRFRELAATDWRPTAPLPVHLYPSLGEYNQFGNDFGADHSSLLGSFFATEHPDRPVAMYFHVNRKQLRMWANHSAFHQFVDRAFANAPPVWVSEGLATYFTYYWEQPYLAAEFERLVSSERWVPLSQIMREGVEAYAADSHARFVELGMLFTYLLHYRADTRTQKNADGVVLLSPAADYCADVLRGRDVSDHPVHELLTTGLREFEAELRGYTFSR